MLLRPAVVGFIEDILHDESSAGMLMENFRVEKGSRMESTTLAQARIREKTGAYVVGLQRETGLVAELDPHTVLEIGDTVIAIGKRHQLDRLGQYLAKG
jgi:TrkA domain protein